jgi:tetratricopeptide (TPR) repeat protein
MKHSAKRSSIAAAAAALAAALLGLHSSGAVAAGADCANPPKATHTISPDVYANIDKATKALGEKKYGEAIGKLNDVADKGGDYDKAVVQYNLGVAYSEKGDYGSGARAFAKALSYNALPPKQAEQLKYNLGQLYVAASEFEEGIKVLRDYIATACGPVTPEAHMFLANALGERKEYADALKEIDVAMAQAKAPKESWLQFRLGIAYEVKEYKECADTLMKLIAMSPQKDEYWKQLSGVVYQMNDPTQAAAVLALAEREGLLEKSGDVMNLYNIYMAGNEPYKAGVLVQKAMDQGQLPKNEDSLNAVANAWINARESDKAETTLKTLASMSDKGEYYYRLGGMYGDGERWKESREMLEKALDKGGLKRPGDAYFRIAVADYSMNDYKSAIAALRKAAGYAETRKQANEWLHHLTTQQAPEAASAEPPADKKS